MPETRAVYNEDWELLKIQHREAFKMMTQPVVVKIWSRLNTVVDDLYDEVVQESYTTVSVDAMIEHNPTQELMKKYGITEKPDKMVWFSLVLLGDASITITNRCRVVLDDGEYDIIQQDDPMDMGHNKLELVCSLRKVQ
jgi:hypothetical protein